MFTDRIPHVIAALGVAASALVAGSAAAVAERHRPYPDLGVGGDQGAAFAAGDQFRRLERVAGRKPNVSTVCP